MMDVEKFEPEHVVSPRHRPATTTISSVSHWALHLFLVGCLLLQSRHLRNDVTELILPLQQQHQPWTPLTEYLSNSIIHRQFMGTFAGWTPFKGPPTAAVESAWSRIATGQQVVRLTEAEMIRMNRSLDSVQLPPELGGGYMGEVEAIHQLHCLKKIFGDHYLEYSKDDRQTELDRPIFYDQHYNHCIDIIRQRLMCTADPGIVTFRWVKGVPGPYPDFNVPHTCGNFEKLLNWNELRSGNLPDDWVWNEPAQDSSIRLASVP